MAGCCGHEAKFDGLSADYKRRLWLVIALNAIMFVVEMTAGHVAKSQALQADALDFLGDSLTYGISLAVIGASIQVRTNAALAKGINSGIKPMFGGQAHRGCIGRVARLCKSAQQAAGNNLSLNFCGTLKDVQNTGIAQHTADFILKRKTVAAMDLQPIVGCGPCHTRA